jgi:hypothetical protein
VAIQCSRDAHAGLRLRAVRDEVRFERAINYASVLRRGVVRPDTGVAATEPVTRPVHHANVPPHVISKPRLRDNVIEFRLSGVADVRHVDGDVALA